MTQTDLSGVNYEVARQRHQTLQVEVDALRRYVIQSELHDFFAVAASTEIELHEAELAMTSTVSDYLADYYYGHLSPDSKAFHTTPIEELTPADIIDHYETVGKYPEADRYAYMHDDKFGLIALFLAEEEPEKAFKCLAKIVDDSARLLYSAITLFQQPANMNIRALLQATIGRDVPNGLGLYYTLNPAYGDFILGLAGDRAAADRAIDHKSVHPQHKRHLMNLFGIDRRIDRGYGDAPRLIDQVLELNDLDKDRPDPRKVRRVSTRDRWNERELQLALGILNGDPDVLTPGSVEFRKYSTLMGAAAFICKLARHGVPDFARDTGDHETNKQRDGLNWGWVLMDVEMDTVDAETVMRALALPEKTFSYPVDLRKDAEHLLGIQSPT